MRTHHLADKLLNVFGKHIFENVSFLFLPVEMCHAMWKGYLSHRRTAKAQALTQYREPEGYSDKEPYHLPYWVTAHARLNDRKLHSTKVPFLMRRLKCSNLWMLCNKCMCTSWKIITVCDHVVSLYSLSLICIVEIALSLWQTIQSKCVFIRLLTMFWTLISQYVYLLSSHQQRYL